MKKDKEQKEILKNDQQPYKFWTKTKKIFAGLIVAVIVAGAAIGLAVGLTGNNNNNPTPPGPEGPSIEQPANPNPGPGEIEKPDPGETEKPDPGEVEKPDPEEPGPVDPGDTEVKIENLGDLLQKHQGDVYNALNEYFFENVGKDIKGRFFKTEKASNIEWYINDGKDATEMTGFTLKFNYDAGSGFEDYILCSVKLQDAIKIGELNGANGINNETIANALKAQADNLECAQEYSFRYSEEYKTENVALKNAICDKLFGENETSTRYIVDQGYQVDAGTGLSEVREFKVVEITENGVQEKIVRIKDDGKDYQENFEAGQYREVGEGTQIDFSGSKLEQGTASLADYLLEMPDGSYFELT